MNPEALLAALNCMSASVIAGRSGKTARAEAAYLDAAVAAPEAFPPGPLADALNLILGAVGDAASGVAA